MTNEEGNDNNNNNNNNNNSNQKSALREQPRNVVGGVLRAGVGKQRARSLGGGRGPLTPHRSNNSSLNINKNNFATPRSAPPQQRHRTAANPSTADGISSDDDGDHDGDGRNDNVRTPAMQPPPAPRVSMSTTSVLSRRRAIATPSAGGRRGALAERVRRLVREREAPADASNRERTHVVRLLAQPQVVHGGGIVVRCSCEHMTTTTTTAPPSLLFLNSADAAELHPVAGTTLVAYAPSVVVRVGNDDVLVPGGGCAKV